MDILHPAMVHFPIGLLSLYALLEGVSIVPALASRLFTAKLVLLFFGTVGAFVARYTGEHDEQYFVQKIAALKLHEDLSLFVVIIFGFLLGIYAIDILLRIKKMKANFLTKFLVHQYVKSFLAVAGFGILTIVGALGGSLVHGPEADPMVRFVTGLLGLR